jgi:hypothetical protein
LYLEVSFYRVYPSEFFVLTQYIPGMIISEIKSRDVFGMFSSHNLPTLESANVATPRPSKYKWSLWEEQQGSRRVVKRETSVLCSAVVTVVFNFMLGGSASSHTIIILALFSSYLTVLWWCYCYCYYFSYYLWLLFPVIVNICWSLPMLRPVKQVSAYSSLDNDRAACCVMTVRG